MLTDVSPLTLGVDSPVASSVGEEANALNIRRACRVTRMTSKRCLQYVARGKTQHAGRLTYEVHASRIILRKFFEVLAWEMISYKPCYHPGGTLIFVPNNVLAIQVCQMA